MAASRNLNLDLLRILGVFIIMIAHASPPEWIFQLRNFGTPLLIVASALTYSAIYSKKSPEIRPFYKKRLVRLILPAWVFISFFFCFFTFLSIAFDLEYLFSVKEIIKTYLFYDGIGFVWIFKVYIILALITPLTVAAMKLPVSNQVYFSVLCFLYFLYEIMLAFSSPLLPDFFLNLFSNTIFIVIPYAILYAYGMRLSKLSDMHIILISVSFFIVFFILCIYKFNEAGSLVPTQGYKYPPTIYYLSYAIGCLNLLYLFCKNISDFSYTVRKAILWLSSNSLWVYLWHIMIFYLWEISGIEFDNEYISFILKAAVMLILGSLLTIIQLYLIENLTSSTSNTGKHIRLILT